MKFNLQSLNSSLTPDQLQMNSSSTPAQPQLNSSSTPAQVQLMCLDISSTNVLTPWEGYPATEAWGPKASAQTDIIFIFIYIQDKLGSPPSIVEHFLDFVPD